MPSALAALALALLSPTKVSVEAPSDVALDGEVRASGADSSHPGVTLAGYQRVSQLDRDAQANNCSFAMVASRDALRGRALPRVVL